MLYGEMKMEWLLDSLRLREDPLNCRGYGDDGGVSPYSSDTVYVRKSHFVRVYFNIFTSTNVDFGDMVHLLQGLVQTSWQSPPSLLCRPGCKSK